MHPRHTNVPRPCSPITRMRYHANELSLPNKVLIEEYVEAKITKIEEEARMKKERERRQKALAKSKKK